MPTGYTPTAVYHSSLILPVNGDPATAPSVNDTALKYLADNTAYLKPVVDARYTWRILTPYDLNTTINPRSDSTSGRNVIDAVTLTGNRTITIDDTGCADGDWVLAHVRTPGLTLTIKDPAAVTLSTLGSATGTGDRDWALFLRFGGAWRTFSRFLYDDTLVASAISTGDIIGTNLNLSGFVGAASITTSGDATVGGAIQGGSLAIAASATLGGSLATVGSITAGTNLYGILSGQFSVETHVDANLTISRNAVHVFAGGGAGNFTWTLFGIGQQDGDWAMVRSNSSGTCTLQDPAGNTLALLSGFFPSANAFVVRAGGVWYVAFS